VRDVGQIWQREYINQEEPPGFSFFHVPHHGMSFLCTFSHTSAPQLAGEYLDDFIKELVIKQLEQGIGDE